MGRAVPGQGSVVLVVDDEAVIRLNAAAMVGDSGFEAIAASNADEALRILESRDDVRAVFTDVHMPGSMDGLGLARVVAERWPAVVLLLTSGKTDIKQSDLPTRGRFLRKPYVTSQVETMLRDLMALPTP
jgi:DNA-binding NtrC family response regulator